MEPLFKIKINPKLYLKDPEQSAIGKNIVKKGLDLILKMGLEQFTFKKLAVEIGTTEATVYRYFENKHRLLIYLVNWYWTHLEYKIIFNTNNLSSAELKLKKVIEILSEIERLNTVKDELNEKAVYDLVMLEGSKAYLTKHVGADNKDRLFKPYKDLCSRLAEIIIEFNPKYKFSHSLASTILEMAHSQNFFMKYLPSLTDFSGQKDTKSLGKFLESLLFSAIRK